MQLICAQTKLCCDHSSRKIDYNCGECWMEKREGVTNVAPYCLYLCQTDFALTLSFTAAMQTHYLRY
jgi:hypothetical protein